VTFLLTGHPAPGTLALKFTKPIDEDECERAAAQVLTAVNDAGEDSRMESPVSLMERRPQWS
jgi:hypothetical protein